MHKEMRRTLQAVVNGQLYFIKSAGKWQNANDLDTKGLNVRKLSNPGK